MNDTTENRSSAISKPPNILDEWNGYPEFFSFSQALEISRKYLLLQTLILQKKVAGCPWKLQIWGANLPVFGSFYSNTLDSPDLHGLGLEGLILNYTNVEYAVAIYYPTLRI